MDVRHGTCTSCDKRYKLPASFPHDRAKCKECGGVVEIGPVESAAPPPPAPEPEPEEPAQEEAPAPKPVPAAKPATRKGVAAATPVRRRGRYR